MPTKQRRILENRFQATGLHTFFKSNPKVFATFKYTQIFSNNITNIDKFVLNWLPEELFSSFSLCYG